MNKQLFLELLSKELDKLENLKDLNLTYLNLTFHDYYPDKKKYDRNYTYREFEINMPMDDGKFKFEISDNSEDFKCDMGYQDCEERGYCNGDC